MARCTVKSRTGSEKLRVAISVDDLHHVRTSFFRVLKPQYRHNNLRLDVSVGCFLAIFHCIFFFRLLTLQIDEAAPRLGLPFTFPLLFIGICDASLWLSAFFVFVFLFYKYEKHWLISLLLPNVVFLKHSGNLYYLRKDNNMGNQTSIRRYLIRDKNDLGSKKSCGHPITFSISSKVRSYFLP